MAIKRKNQTVNLQVIMTTPMLRGEKPERMFKVLDTKNVFDVIPGDQLTVKQMEKLVKNKDVNVFIK